ncbi:ATP synthase A1 subunit C [Candidatus Woesearchaeota archaeon]|jgi:V/A-type H+/Na+-transporting ATPase subunit C|nr:ATP synthase A1 subunit C [Candidatus Woesearchaeota archaeon]
MANKIKLQECYPYTYVRVITMKSKLLGRDDYNKLLKMGFNEIAKYLQDSEYKREINELAIELSGADLLEAALDKNLIASYNKLWRISPDELDLLINAYVKRYDYFNIKTIIRGKFAKLSEEEIKKVLKPVGMFSSKFIDKIIDEDSVEKIIEKSKLLNKKVAQKLIKDFKENQSLLMIENVLDKAYFDFVFEFSETIPKQGHLFKEFLLNEIDILNIKQLLRLKKDGMKNSDIEEHICMVGKELKKENVSKMIKQEYKDVIKTLLSTKFKPIIKKHFKTLESKESLVNFENALDKYLLKKSLSLLHQNPLSIDIILGYMFAKEIEVKNIKTLVKAKQLGMDEEFISQQLIVN